MDYLQYRTDLYRKRAGLTLPPCVNREPILTKTAQGFWIAEWVLVFPDGKYVRMWENYEKVKGRPISARQAFSFHYGPLGSGIRPENYSVGAPVVMRADKPNGQPAHLHYLGPVPHYSQEKVHGLQLDNLDMFDWLNAVLRHRTEGRALHEILAFTVEV